MELVENFEAIKLQNEAINWFNDSKENGIF